MIKRLTVLALFLLAVAPAAAAPAKSAGVSSITVTGQGSASHAPDFATVGAAILTTDDDSTNATSDNNTRYEALRAALVPLGAEIQTSYYNVNYNPPPQPTVQRPVGYYPRYGYTVSRQLQIKVSSIASTGAVVDAIIHTGGTSVNNVTYGVNDQRALFAVALKGAMLDARSQAEAIAVAAGVRIFRLKSVQSGYNGGPIRYMGIPAPTSAPMVAGAPTNLEPSDVHVNATITAVYDVGP
ncbi:MAG: SIMPL domain-containing protein [Candidatus Eremiobacteraeota bacterium]|nr:SIMPL domain-containing protein [Candidatus Eremiobacteraeota bacterium]